MTKMVENIERRSFAFRSCQIGFRIRNIHFIRIKLKFSPVKIYCQPLNSCLKYALQLECMNADWKLILKQTQLHLNLLEPFIAFRHGLLQILKCKECTAGHLLESASTLRKVIVEERAYLVFRISSPDLFLFLDSRALGFR